MPLGFHQWPIQMMWRCERKPGRWKPFCEVASCSHRSAGIASLQCGPSGKLPGFTSEFVKVKPRLRSPKTQDLLKRYHPDSMARLARRTNKAGTYWYIYIHTCIIYIYNMYIYIHMCVNMCRSPFVNPKMQLRLWDPERQRWIRWFNFWLDIANGLVTYCECIGYATVTAHFEWLHWFDFLMLLSFANGRVGNVAVCLQTWEGANIEPQVCRHDRMHIVIPSCGKMVSNTFNHRVAAYKFEPVLLQGVQCELYINKSWDWL